MRLLARRRSSSELTMGIRMSRGALARRDRECLDLIPEDCRLVEENPQRTVPVKRVAVRSDQSSGHELVAAEVEEAKVDRPVGEDVVGPAVDSGLLRPGRESVPDDDGELGAIEADPLGPIF